jgi:hypothetical protein
MTAATNAKSAKGHAERGAQKTTNSKTFKALTRVGFIAYGVLHVLVAYLAVQVAFGDSGQEADQGGAFQTLAQQPFGEFVLVVIVIGLCAMAIWQAVLAFVGHRAKDGAMKWLERFGSGARAVVYGNLAFMAGKVIGGAPTSQAQKQQSTASGVMAHSYGVVLVGIAGLVVIGIGIGMAVYGFLHKFEDKMHTEEMSMRTRKTGRRVGQVGYVAKGVAYTIVGVLLMDAAITHDPKNSRGLDSALHTLAEQPYGKILLLIVAAGILAYAVFAGFFQARYRKVGT